LERDHIVPIYQGGSDAITNIQPLCKRCNCAKGPETTDWAQRRREHGFEEAA
jgi:5-methylcytosine-specific restriction endonuclease McrA